MLDTGELPKVQIGGCVRIARTAIDSTIGRCTITGGRRQVYQQRQQEEMPDEPPAAGRKMPPGRKGE